jgi:hypothetical protein
MRLRNTLITLFAIVIGSVLATQAPAQDPVLDRQAVIDFEKRAQEYVTLRESLEAKLPKLPKKATPEQIEAHKAALLKAVIAARRGSRRGQIFTPQASRVLREIIRQEFKGRDRVELRKTVFEAETKGVPVRVNAAYPESVEILEMPPTLLLALPQLPKQLRFRFVGSYMLLVDRENSLIVDYMTNALP